VVSSGPSLRPSVEVFPSPPSTTPATKPISSQISVTSLTVPKSMDSTNVDMSASPPVPDKLEEKLDTVDILKKSQELIKEPSALCSSSRVVSEMTRLAEIPASHPGASESGTKLSSAAHESTRPAKLAAPVPVVAVKPNPIITVKGNIAPLASTSSAATTTSTPKKSDAVIIKKKKIMSKNMFESHVGTPLATPSGTKPLKRPGDIPIKSPVKRPKKLMSLQPTSTKIQTGVIQIPNLTSIIPVSVQPHALTPAVPLRLPFTHGAQVVGGPGALIVAPFRPASKPALPSARKVVPLKSPAVGPKKINLVKPITITPKSLPISSPGKFGSPTVSKALPTHEKLIKKNVKQPVKSTKLTCPVTASASTSFPNPLIPIKQTPTMTATKKEDHVVTVMDCPVPSVSESTISRPALPPKHEDKQLSHVEINPIGEKTEPFALVVRVAGTSEQVQMEIPPAENKPKDIIVETKLVSSLFEDESCNSLLCAEEIPGSPPPGLDSDRFRFDDESARHHSPTPGLCDNNELQRKPTLQLPISFDSICTKPANELEGKGSVELERHGSPLKPVVEASVGEPHQLPSTSQLLIPQSEFEDEYMKDKHNPESCSSHAYPLPSPEADLCIDNSPPTTPESSTSLSSGSPRG